MPAPATTTLLHGDVREQLGTLPAESVSCVITSPPYLGLRVYGTEPQVWGGLSDCDHQWGEEEPPRRARWGDLDTLVEKQASNRGSASNVAAMEASTGCFCRTCGAWRGELGSEPQVGLYIAHLVEVFREVRRVLRRDGICWLNIGDSYCTAPFGNREPAQDVDGAFQRRMSRATAATGADPQKRVIDWSADRIKAKDLCLIPQRLAIALQEDGWWVRADVIWHKPNPLPESVADRPMTKDHEYVWMLTRSERYYWDDVAVREAASPESPARAARGRKANAKYADGGPGKQSICSGAPVCRGHASGAEVPYQNNRSSRHGYAIPEGPTRRLRSVWKIPGESFSGCHFATFPQRLVEVPIRASTSEAGCCGICGAPWVRITELGAPDLDHQQACGGDLNGAYDGVATKDFESAGAQNASAVKARILEGMRERRTTGWRPGCACHSTMAGPPIPCTVLDPFAGSGTVLAVAKRLGRSAIGIDLNADYLELARQRIEAVA